MTLRPSLDRLHAALDALQHRARADQLTDLAEARLALAGVEAEVVKIWLNQHQNIGESVVAQASVAMQPEQKQSRLQREAHASSALSVSTNVPIVEVGTSRP